MDIPLMGSAKANYRFFYTAGGSVIISLVILLIITSYSAYIATDVNKLLIEMHDVLHGVKELLPEAKFGADMLGLLCENKNFTNYYPNVRPICAEHH